MTSRNIANWSEWVKVTVIWLIDNNFSYWISVYLRLMRVPLTEPKCLIHYKLIHYKVLFKSKIAILRSSFSLELKFLPLFIMLVHVALFGTKIVVTHITICGIILQLFAAAWTSYWHIQCYYQLSIYFRSIESLLLWCNPLFENNWICVKFNSRKLLTSLKHEIFSFR